MEKVLAAILRLASYPKETGWCPPSFCLLLGDAIVAAMFEFYGSRPTWAFYGNRLTWNAFLEGALDSDLSTSDKAMLKEMKQSISGGGRGVISEWKSSVPNLEPDPKARQLVNQSTNSERAIVFWPLADLYEVIDSPSNSIRLRELGVVK
jgi:hypothetical protein